MFFFPRFLRPLLSSSSLLGFQDPCPLARRPLHWLNSARANQEARFRMCCIHCGIRNSAESARKGQRKSKMEPFRRERERAWRERAPLRRLFFFSSSFSSLTTLLPRLSNSKNSLGLLPLAPLLLRRRRALSSRAGPPSSCALPVRDSFFSSLLFSSTGASLSR